MSGQPTWWLHTVIDEDSLGNPLCGHVDSDCREMPLYRGQVTQPRGTFDVFACAKHAFELRKRLDLTCLASWRPR